MNSVEYAGKTVEYPGEWDELSRKQLLFITKLLDKGLTVIEFKLIVLMNFLKIKYKMFARISDTNKFMLTETVNFLNRDVSLTEAVIQFIRVSWLRKYYAPASRLTNCNIIEFRYSENFYRDYVDTQKTEHMDKLIATLYRPKKFFHFIRKRLNNYDGDPRMKFNDKFILARAKKIRRMPFHYKYGIFLFYRGCRSFIAQRYNRVFVESDSTEKKPEKFDWGNIIRQAAGGKFGQIMQTAETNIYTFLSELQERIIEAEKIERKYSRK